jgi:hypothetical protein
VDISERRHPTPNHGQRGNRKKRRWCLQGKSKNSRHIMRRHSCSLPVFLCKYMLMNIAKKKLSQECFLLPHLQGFNRFLFSFFFHFIRRMTLSKFRVVSRYISRGKFQTVIFSACYRTSLRNSTRGRSSSSPRQKPT